MSVTEETHNEIVSRLEARVEGLERLLFDRDASIKQAGESLVKATRGCQIALPALELASAFIRGIYKAETVEELTAEAMNETEIAVGKALDHLRSLNP